VVAEYEARIAFAGGVGTGADGAGEALGIDSHWIVGCVRKPSERVDEHEPGDARGVSVGCHDDHRTAIADTHQHGVT
jgi:hypothetical protein